jgi:hypothetical protein
MLLKILKMPTLNPATKVVIQNMFDNITTYLNKNEAHTITELVNYVNSLKTNEPTDSYLNNLIDQFNKCK